MSMYSMFFGKNPDASVILATLGLSESDVERFRDCFIRENEIVIYTRTGGDNREYYPNTALTENEHYLRDEDDDVDCTYASYYFSFPARTLA